MEKDIAYIQKHFDYFSHMPHLEIIRRQVENKSNKFFLRNGNQYYTLCCDSTTENRKLCDRLSILRQIFTKNIPQILYRQKDDRYLVLEYVGNGDGKSLYDIEKEQIPIDITYSVEQLHTLVNQLHTASIDYGSYTLSSNPGKWYRNLYMELYRHTKKLQELNLLNQEECQIVMDFCKIHREILQHPILTYIHGDLKPQNTCINLKTNELYLIDFDMFQIGDPFIDTQKIIWTRNFSKVFDTYAELYCKDYSQDLYLLYWLKIKMFSLPFRYKQKDNYASSLEQTKQLIQQAKNKLNHFVL